MKNLFKFCLLATMIFLPFSCDQDSLDIPGNSPGDDLTASKAVNSKLTVSVISPVAGFVVNGTSTLHRNKKGVTVNFKTDGLIQGHAYTLWWVIFNVPGECEGVPCIPPDLGNPYVKGDLLYATGHVAGANGTGNFSAHLNVGDNSGSIAHLFNPIPFAYINAEGEGLMDAQDAEIHLVLRSHGPAVPGIVNEQIGSYLGGCPTNPPYGLSPADIPMDVGECADIIAAIHVVEP